MDIRPEKLDESIDSWETLMFLYNSAFISQKLVQDPPEIVQYGYSDGAPVTPNVKKNTVIGGMVRNPVIAVPTSVGYGANMQGLTALLTMINSCANGVAVVNIDNGYGAGYMATQIGRLAASGRNRE